MSRTMQIDIRLVPIYGRGGFAQMYPGCAALLRAACCYALRRGGRRATSATTQPANALSRRCQTRRRHPPRHRKWLMPWPA